MKLFDYEILYLAARGDPKTIVQLFIKWDNGGNSWIKNPEAIVESQGSYSNRDIAEYIGLCSLRPRGSLNLHKNQLPPWVPWEVVTNNPLIKVDGSLIIFYKEK